MFLGRPWTASRTCLHYRFYINPGRLGANAALQVLPALRLARFGLNPPLSTPLHSHQWCIAGVSSLLAHGLHKEHIVVSVTPSWHSIAPLPPPPSTLGSSSQGLLPGVNCRQPRKTAQTTFVSMALPTSTQKCSFSEVDTSPLTTKGARVASLLHSPLERILCSPRCTPKEHDLILIAQCLTHLKVHSK